MQTEKFTYNDKVVRMFVWASAIWGIVGMLVGVIIATQLAWWPANIEPYLTFGRLRPLHTNAVIFAFVGNAIFAGVYYSTQRLTKARMWSDGVSMFHFWGWQAIIVSAAITLPLGITQSKEYAELEWPIDLAVAVVWLAFGLNFFMTLKNRREEHIYVAIWFYIATIITITMLYVFNNLALPVFVGVKSYSVYAGAADAMVQWWYGHNAVAFFLTTPILGLMYYYVPKAAERPVFSYRLSIIHFWSLIFVYIWAGPHHLLNTALPDWVQTSGMLFSLMLWAPSWGGMLNGLLTLRGAWDRLRRDPILKMFAVGITSYGMSTFEGPLLSIKSVSSIGHYTDWIIGHVHNGALGWNGFIAAGMFYWMIPRLYGKKLHSVSLANTHFWIGTIGIVLYVVSMWIAGVTQGLMWRAENEGGGLLYPSFVETLIALKPLYWTRALGGTLYLGGMIIMLFNLVMTAKAGAPTTVEDEAPPLKVDTKTIPWTEIWSAPPVWVTAIVLVLVMSVGFVEAVPSTIFMGLAVAITLAFFVINGIKKKTGKYVWHHIIEGRTLIFSIFSAIAVAIGGAAQIIPLVIATPETIASTSNVPYTPLELEGRDVYISEGCYVCHSQMVRPFTWETARFPRVHGSGPSVLEDSIFDHPFQWGSRRIGPDLAFLGDKYNHTWHYRHMLNPREVTPGSNMPNYTHMAYQRVDLASTAVKMRGMRALGVPYTAEEIEQSERWGMRQSREITDFLAEDANVRLCEEGQSVESGDCDLYPDSQLVALISYLQRLGNPPSERGLPSDLDVEVSMNDTANEEQH